MQPFLVTGLVQFDDSFAAAARGGIECGSLDCTVVVPEDGRVLAFEATSAVSDVTFSGGRVTLLCHGNETTTPSLSMIGVHGNVHATGCAISTCERFSGTLMADWPGSAECTGFDGTFVSLGESDAVVSGSGTLNSGGTGVTTLVGSEWTISGTGPVNFNGVDEFSFVGGTAGIEVVDWAWMKRPAVTIWEFASAAPQTDFIDQSIEVIGGWPEGSTLTRCTASGTLGYVPMIRSSSVFAAEHTYGPIVSVVEDSELNGDLRADGRVFLNNVRGDITVSTQTTFVNTYSESDELLIDGPHTVMCPTCGRVLPYDASMNVVETDVLLEAELDHDIDLAGHTLLLGNVPPSRRRRNTIEVNGTTTILPNSGHTITGGNVTLVENITLTYDLTLTDVVFNISDFVVGVDYSYLRIFGSTIYAKQSFQPTIKMQLQASVALKDLTVNGFLIINVTNEATAYSFLSVASVETENAGGIGITGPGEISYYQICDLRWSQTPDITMSYILVINRGTNFSDVALNSLVTGEPICFYYGSSPDVTNDAGACTSTNFYLQTPQNEVDPTVSLNQCDQFTTSITTSTSTSTTTTSTLTTTPATTTTTPRPRASSESSDLSNSEIAGIVVGAILASVLLVSGVLFAKSKFGRKLNYSRLDNNSSQPM